MSVFKCIVPDCGNNTKDNFKLSFFRIPKDDKLKCYKWLTNVNRGDLLEKDPLFLYNNHRICMMHFEDDMFSSLMKNRLSSTAEPTKNLPLKGITLPLLDHDYTQQGVSSLCVIRPTTFVVVYSQPGTSCKENVVPALTFSNESPQNMSVQTSKSLSPVTPRKQHKKKLRSVRLKQKQLLEKSHKRKITKEEVLECVNENSAPFAALVKTRAGQVAGGEMEQITCRTCLVTIPDKKKCREISRICCLQKTVKDVIVMLVPQMDSTLIENDCVCNKCFHTLKTSFKFITRCLEVEMLNAEKREVLEEQNDVDDFIEFGVKDTEIKDEVLLVDESQPFTLDHNYDIKVEPKDCDDFIIESEDQSVNNVPEKYSAPIEIVFESPLLKNALLDIKDKELNPPENVLQESQSLYNEIKDKDNIIVVNDDLLQESLTCNKSCDSENSQPTSVNPPKTDKWSCQTCSEKFTCESDYNLHLDIHPLVICHHCGKGFKTNKAYKKHTQFHTRQGSRVCEVCGKCFNELGALNVHINNVHKTERTFMCDRCPKRFKSNLRLRIHIKVIHDRVTQEQCQECGKVFRSRVACRDHYRLIHLKLKPFVCKVCGKEFGRKDYVRNHMAVHTQERCLKKSRVPKYGVRLKNSGKPVDCKVCGKRISNIHNLKLHLETHVKMGRHKCKYCDLTFTQVSSRVRHEKIHEKDLENKFRCDICWKRMKTKEELEKHVEAHSKVRPPQHSCDVCGEKFHRKYLLDNHRLNQHTGPEDYKKAEQEMANNLLQHIHPDS